MSRVGSKEIIIPDNVKVSIQGDIIFAEGPLGKLETKLHETIATDLSDNKISFSVKKESKQSLAFWGLQRNLVNNLVIGVSTGFTKKLEMNGVGYRASLKGNNIELLLGYSHPIIYPIPEDIKVTVDKQNNIEISGASKQLVGQVASEIRSFRGPEPYKGKGVKYADEQINRKEGKKK
jgi:large subunit ribosomal protein L6